MMVVVSYDVCDDGRRSRVARLCLDYGTRVQKSVFECHLDDKRLAKLMERMGKLIDHGEDSVRYYSLCKKCFYAVEVQGEGTVTQETDLVIL